MLDEAGPQGLVPTGWRIGRSWDTGHCKHSSARPGRPCLTGPALGSRCAPAFQSPRSESPVGGLFGWKHSLLGSCMCIEGMGLLRGKEHEPQTYIFPTPAPHPKSPHGSRPT